MTAISFTVPGQVVAWRRSRLGKLPNGKPMHFKDGGTVAYQNLWKMAADEAFGASDLLTGALRMTVLARFTPPASASKKRRALMLAGEIRPTVKPDADNIAKSADSLNGLIWKDDAQVAELIVRKVYAETAGLDITIEGIAA